MIALVGLKLSETVVEGLLVPWKVPCLLYVSFHRMFDREPEQFPAVSEGGVEMDVDGEVM